MTHPHDRTDPDHALDPAGELGLAYDPSCEFCRSTTAAPLPGSAGHPSPSWLQSRAEDKPQQEAPR